MRELKLLLVIFVHETACEIKTAGSRAGGPKLLKNKDLALSPTKLRTNHNKGKRNITTDKDFVKIGKYEFFEECDLQNFKPVIEIEQDEEGTVTVIVK